MSVKKYLSLPKLQEYDSLLKSKIATDDAAILSSSKSYTDSEILKIKSGTVTVENANHAASADSATKATQDGNGKVISETYETKTDASSKLETAKSYTDNAISTHNHDSDYDEKGAAASALSSATELVNTLESSLQTQIDGKVPTTRKINNKALSADISLTASDVGADVFGAAATAESNANSYTDEKIALLLNNSSEAVDSIYELRDAMTENADAISALNGIAANKANASDLTAHVNNKENPHGVTLSQLGVTATAAEVNVMDGITASTAELNYVKGVTSSVQTQLNSKAAQTSLDSHTSDGDIHVTVAKKNNWDSAYTHSTQAHAPADAQKNQNAFSNVKIGTSTIAAGSVTDTLNLVAGENVTLSASGKDITIAASCVTVDSEMSETSTNPVQNKVISSAIGTVAESVLLNSNTISTHTTAISNLQTAMDEIQEITSADIQALFA